MDMDSKPQSPPEGDPPIDASDATAVAEMDSSCDAPQMKSSDIDRPEPLSRPGSGSDKISAWINGLFAGVCLYFFLSAINVMGAGLKTLGKNTDWLENLLASAHNPFVALMGSVLVTAIVQSSSFTTSLIITLVAAGQLDMADAVYAIMGANIGTSVTNIIVSFGNVRIKHQFRRAFTAALVHDIFNWLTVAILFPIEWISQVLSKEGVGILTRTSLWAAQSLGLEEIEKPNSPIKVITKPVVEVLKSASGWVSDDPVKSGSSLAIAGLVMMFISLFLLVTCLKGALLSRIEGLFRRFFFRNDVIAYVVGVLTTILVQSSSVTTSLIVPLAGAGAVHIRRVFAYTLGANLGTTVTGVIAASANPKAAAVAVAIAHVTFNLIGTSIWYPLRSIPIKIASWYADLAADNKKFALLFLVVVFVVLPGVGIAITKMF